MRELDLTWGQPIFIAEQWVANKWKQDKHSAPITHVSNLKYQDDNATRALEFAIRATNVSYPEHSLVLGNGASQILDAYSGVIGTRISYEAPHWPRFNILLNRNEYSSWGATPVKLVTYPNNPNGSLYDLSDADIVDASYHWPHYYRKGEIPKKLVNDTIVFSFAKLTGFASMRLGWAFVRNKDMAAEMKDYIEMTTGPVSLEAQCKAFDILKRKNIDPVVAKAKQVLEYRWEQLEQFYVGKHRGMFLYVYDPEYKFEAKNIKGQRGKAFGEASDDMIRVNIGCSTEDFKELIERISIMHGMPL